MARSRMHYGLYGAGLLALSALGLLGWSQFGRGSSDAQAAEIPAGVHFLPGLDSNRLENTLADDYWLKYQNHWATTGSIEYTVREGYGTGKIGTGKAGLVETGLLPDRISSVACQYIGGDETSAAVYLAACAEDGANAANRGGIGAWVKDNLAQADNGIGRTTTHGGVVYYLSVVPKQNLREVYFDVAAAPH